MQNKKNPTNSCSPQINLKIKSNEHDKLSNKVNKSNDDCFKSSIVEDTLNEENKHKPTDILNSELNDLPSNSQEPVKTEQSPNQAHTNECDIHSQSLKTNSPSTESIDNMDVTSTTQELPKTPPIKLNKKLNDAKISSEDKMKQYIDEYDSFIQQVSSPLNEPEIKEEIVQSIKQETENESNEIVDENRFSEKELPKNEVSSSTSSSQKIEEKIDEHSSSSSSSSDGSSSSSDSSSSSSSSTSDDSSSSSDTSSSSSSDNDSSDDDNNSSRRKKSSSKSSSSRSASKSPRFPPLKINNCKNAF